MIYVVITMGKQKIPLENEAIVMSVMEQANAGTKLILTKHGIINASSIDSIVPYKEKMNEVAETLRYHPNEMTLADAEREALGRGIFTQRTLDLIKARNGGTNELGPGRN